MCPKALPMEKGKVLSCTAHYTPRLKFQFFIVYMAHSSMLCRGSHIHKRRGACGEKAKGFEIVSNFPNTIVNGSKMLFSG